MHIQTKILYVIAMKISYNNYSLKTLNSGTVMLVNLIFKMSLKVSQAFRVESKFCNYKQNCRIIPHGALHHRFQVLRKCNH